MFTALLAVFIGTAAGEGRSKSPGAFFLRLPPDARSTGLGEAFTAAVDDASAMWWNPGGLGFIHYAPYAAVSDLAILASEGGYTIPNFTVLRTFSGWGTASLSGWLRTHDEIYWPYD
ncbi:MAG: hypothetical protein C4524_08065 [Candidatus Zixiibacteriota bacterium]|nr:MAG: hypothetical protein C4524_08065 [candidate division Zixibacteria bacterium]